MDRKATLFHTNFPINGNVLTLNCCDRRPHKYRNRINLRSKRFRRRRRAPESLDLQCSAAYTTQLVPAHEA